MFGKFWGCWGTNFADVPTNVLYLGDVKIIGT